MSTCFYDCYVLTHKIILISLLCIFGSLLGCGGSSSQNELSSSIKSSNASQSSNTSMAPSSALSSQSSLTTMSSSSSSLDSCNVTSSLSSYAPTVNATDYFVNTVFDDSPTIFFAPDDFDTAGNTHHTSQLQSVLNQASTEDADGGVVIIRSHVNGNKRIRLGLVNIPSNVRLEIDPDIVIEMLGNKAGNTTATSRILFAVGRSTNNNNLNPNVVRNVEIKSTSISGERFTIDSSTNFPRVYVSPTNSSLTEINGIPYTDQNGTNRTQAIPVGFWFVENFSASGINIIDNHTVSVGVQMYPDCGACNQGAWVNPQTSALDDDVFLDGSSGNPLPVNAQGEFIDSDGQVIPDHIAIVRNPAFSRTPRKGTIENIRIESAHTGYGAVQAYGADYVLIRNIEAVNGVGVRLESGNGDDTDDINKAGLYYSSINNIEVYDVTVKNAFMGVWLSPHGKLNTNILIKNVTAIDSATAIMTNTSGLNPSVRAYNIGRFENTRIEGDIKLIRSVQNQGLKLAEVGNMATFFMSPAERALVADTNGNGSITQADLMRNQSGLRWYLMEPTSPVIMASRFSLNHAGEYSVKTVDKKPYWSLDISKANIVTCNQLRPELILYNSDARNLDGTLPEFPL